MYYLFIRKEQDLAMLRREFDRVREAMDAGKTPVYNEMRSTKTSLCESLAYIPVSGFLLYISAWIMSMMGVNEYAIVGITFAMNSLVNILVQFLVVRTKHVLRLMLCDRLGVERSERSIAVFESMEYQSV